MLELADGIEDLHPAPFRSVPRATFRGAARSLATDAGALTRDELVVRLMRLTVLGDRNGHTGIYPFDPGHTRTLHAYPLRLYDFSDGLAVVSADRADLVGRRVTAIDGTPIARVVELVRPLVPHDNESSRRWLLPEYVVTAEVLRGLGIVRGGTATFELSGGARAELAPVAAGAVAARHGSALSPPIGPGSPLWLRRLDVQHWLTTLERGRVVYLAYRLTTGSTSTLADRLLRHARRPGVRRVVVDVRLNHGGDNTTYFPLVDVLGRPAVSRKLTVLLGRSTFSAAGNFVAELDEATKARFVGEPSGGAPNQWGDSAPFTLERTGLVVRIASQWVEKSRTNGGLATRPDVRVEPTSSDFAGGRDPVLTAALR